MPRTRTHVAHTPGGGTAYRFIPPSTTSNETQLPNGQYGRVVSVCIDEVGRWFLDNPLAIERTTRDDLPLTGEQYSGATLIRKYQNWYAGLHYSNVSHVSGMTSLIPSVGTVATEVLARSNPSKPYVSIPNFIYELKDLPGMIKGIGDLRIQRKNFKKVGFQGIHPKVASDHYLSYVMGWSPLINDLRKLLDFQAKVDKKLRELDNLFNNGGLHRRVKSGNWVSTQTGSSSRTIESGLGALITVREDKFSHIERWGTVRWLPTVPSNHFSSKKLAKLARDLTFGMNGISSKQAWDAIPWTWLIGWFSNVDTFMQAYDNQLPCTHSTPCIMTKIETTTSWTRTDNHQWCRGGTGERGYVEKFRTLSSGSLSATMPFLSARQFSILGALHIQRRR